jgi:triacylglycerol lipase
MEQETATATFTASVAYALCSYVDGATTTLPASWKPIWVPDRDVKGHTATVFRMFPISETLQPVFGLAIQGTETFMDLVNDFQVNQQPAFPIISGAAIAIGSQDGLNDILALTHTSGGTVQTMQDFLMSLPSCTLLVTGHSLGGNIASVLAPWIAANVPAFGGQGGQPITGLPPSLATMTFAAPTAGNDTFASFLNGQSNYQAYFNANDVVPHVWAASGPWSAFVIDGLFPSPGPNPAPGFVQTLIKDKMNNLAKLGISYTQTNGTTFTFPTVAAPKNDWYWELDYQHNYAYCMQFLGKAGNCKPPKSEG